MILFFILMICIFTERQRHSVTHLSTVYIHALDRFGGSTPGKIIYSIDSYQELDVDYGKMMSINKLTVVNFVNFH